MCLICQEANLSTVFCWCVFVIVCDATSQSEGVIKRDLFWNMLLCTPIKNTERKQSKHNVKSKLFGMCKKKKKKIFFNAD